MLVNNEQKSSSSAYTSKFLWDAHHFHSFSPWRPVLGSFCQYKSVMDSMIWRVFSNLDDSMILCQQDISNVQDQTRTRGISILLEQGNKTHRITHSFEQLQWWGIYSFSGKPVPVSDHPCHDECLPYINLNLPSFSVKLLALVLSPQVPVKRLWPFFLNVSFICWKATEEEGESSVIYT